MLQDTHRTLMPAKQSATNGHVTLLKQKMLTAILRRLDCVLFDKLTAGTVKADGFFVTLLSPWTLLTSGLLIMTLPLCTI